MAASEGFRPPASWTSGGLGKKERNRVMVDLQDAEEAQAVAALFTKHGWRVVRPQADTLVEFLENPGILFVSDSASELDIVASAAEFCVVVYVRGEADEAPVDDADWIVDRPLDTSLLPFALARPK
jgi:hypothetical protein